MILTLRWPLQGAAALDLTPSMHWRTPVFVHRVEDEEGPILLTVEYRIDPADAAAFLAVIHEIGLERKRDGAYAWGVSRIPERAAGSSRHSSFSRCSNSSTYARG